MAIASIGTTIKVGDDFTMTQHTNFGDLGGTPSTLDATTLLDRMKKSVPGVQDAGELEIEYFFSNKAATSDYRKLKAMELEGTVKPVEITLQDGTVFKSTAYVTTYVLGAQVDELIKARAVFMLQSAWEVTNPSA